jgi:hypothetical protein
MKLRHYIFLVAIISSSQNISSEFGDIGKDLAKDGLFLYTFAMTSLIAHELGHAVVAKFFWDSPLDITLGAQPDETNTQQKKQPLFTFKSLKFQSLNPFAGGFARANSCPPDEDTSYKALYEKIAVFSAGPLAGLTFLWTACTAFNVCSCRTYNWYFASLMLHQINQLICTADQITDGKNQEKTKNDGEHIYEALVMLRKKRLQNIKDSENAS